LFVKDMEEAKMIPLILTRLRQFAF
jgi:hypothetical protein